MDNSFAFVEYEDRRDADDAYHEMHNKRIGRDDILKIEVRHMILTVDNAWCPETLANLSLSGLVLLLLPPGALSQAVIVTDVVVPALLDVDVLLLLVAALVIILLARTTAGIVTETMTARADVTGIAPVALTIGTFISDLLCWSY
jgi:hypothetical protein